MTFAGVPLAEITESRASDKDFAAIGHEQGLREGRQQGLREGFGEGLREGKREEAPALVLRLLHHRCGGITEALQKALRTLPTEWLEALAEALLDAQTTADLERWLAEGDLG